MNKRSVLCAVDFSAVTNAALQFAVEEVLLRDARLDIVHVWNSAQEPEEPQRLAAEQQLAALHVPPECSDHRKHLLRGMPRDTIAELARELGSDILVVGSHSRPALARWVLGSVAHALTKVSPCPVVVVPAVDAADAPVDLPQNSTACE